MCVPNARLKNALGNFVEQMKQIDIELGKNKEYLDKIDFIPYIEKSYDIDGIIELVQEDYDDTDFTNNDILRGNILNCYDTYDFKIYLEKRYNIKFYEQIEIKYYII